MKCSIMQPSYLPWAGYFNLIAESDQFVFLDDVQFEKSSWQNRNRVLISGKPHWITVPAMREHLSQTIREIAIDDRNRWRDKQMKLLAQNYGKAPYIEEVLSVIAPILMDRNLQQLHSLNISLIEAIAEALGIEASFKRSSELNISGSRTSRLIRICEILGCNEYLSAEGAREYIAEDGDFETASVSVKYQEYEPRRYQQLNSAEFVSRLSIVDVWAHLGSNETRSYVYQETKAPH